MKIIALHGGGDWSDASAEYVILPEGVDIKEEKEKRDNWYSNEYCPSLRRREKPKYFSFREWLILRGATIPTIDQLEIFDDT